MTAKLITRELQVKIRQWGFLTPAAAAWTACCAMLDFSRSLMQERRKSYRERRKILCSKRLSRSERCPFSYSENFFHAGKFLETLQKFCFSPQDGERRCATHDYVIRWSRDLPYNKQVFQLAWIFPARWSRRRSLCDPLGRANVKLGRTIVVSVLCYETVTTTWFFFTTSMTVCLSHVIRVVLSGGFGSVRFLSFQCWWQ